MANHRNYWFSTAPTRHNVSSGMVRNADVLIIGGGIAGISLLYTLLNAGVTNTYLVEESTIGSHASGRGSGQLMLRGFKLFSEMLEKDGIEYLEYVGENNRRFLSGLRRVTFDTDLRDSGGLRLATTKKELAALEKESDFILKHRDLQCPILSAKELLGLMPQTNFMGGMFVPNEAIFNPYKVVNGLREFIEKKGARVITDAQVSAVTENVDGTLAVSIRHRGTIRAKQIVYATNAYIPELLPELADAMIPYRGQMIATDYLDHEIVSHILPAMSMSCNDSREYFRVHNGRLLVGGMRHAVRGRQIGITNDGEVSTAVYEKLRNFAIEAFPFLKNTKFTHTWSGIMAATPDGLPLIGKVRDNQFVLGGFNGYGFSHALQGSMIIKDLISSGKSSHAGVRLFDPARFLETV